MRKHIQNHNHKQNFNTLAAELREELFGDCDIFEFGNYAMLALGFSTFVSLGIYLAVFYLV